jgi:NAD+ kinase
MDSAMTRKILVVVHGGRAAADDALGEAVAELEASGVDVVLHADNLSAPFAKLSDYVEQSEAVVVIGGDGTILRAAELTYGTRVPILGVNLGHLGFLAETERDNLRSAMRRLAAHDYEVEERSVVEVAALRPGDGEPVTGWALNEVTIEKAQRHRVVEVGIEVDGRGLESFGCDGIIIATPTGSTAHAFSAGGPVIWPDVDGVLIVPLAAHALFARPLVIGPRSVVRITVLDESPVPAVLTCDGRRTVDLPAGSAVEVRRGDQPLRFARLSQAPFTDRIVAKFSLPVAGWRAGATGTRAMAPWDADDEDTEAV